MPDDLNSASGDTARPADLRPVPDRNMRKAMARRIREEAADVAHDRAPTVMQTDNGALRAALLEAPTPDGWIPAHETFTKGLTHDDFGRVRQGDLAAFVAAINQDGNGPDYDESPFPFTYDGPLMGKPAQFDAPLHDAGSAPYTRPAGMVPRGWESPISGHTFDLEGADADQAAMAPAPAIGDPELTAEMAEVYGAALIRDIPFETWAADPKVGAVAAALARLPYFTDPADPGTAAGRRRLARLANGSALTHENLFRGSTTGAKTGPYVSQFMYLGNERRSSGDPVFKDKQPPPVPDHGSTTVTEGMIRYGGQVIPQSFLPHKADIDHMVEWRTWLDVQNGADRKTDLDLFEAQPRFIATPRDLATYVHFDALYQAYLNATLLLLGAGAATDAGLPEGPGGKRDAFATFGGPHVLTLVCEVATRALKAVRRQKFNIHLRARPEALAAAVSLAWTGEEDTLATLGSQAGGLRQMADDMQAADGLLDMVQAHNAMALGHWDGYGWPTDHGPLSRGRHNALLPMAFPEGSPMHPAYGAGHATVAGACVTIVKAFFEMYQGGPARGFSLYDVLGVDRDTKDFYRNVFPSELFGEERALTVTRADWAGMDDAARREVPFATAVLPDPDDGYRSLKAIDAGLAIQQELDKLAANISIGRNFAGVHYYTDYFDSIRMGERLAVSILQEQMLTYREPVSMRFTSFDGDRIMLVGTGGSRGGNDTPVLVWDDAGRGGDRTAFDAWWSRHAI